MTSSTPPQLTKSFPAEQFAAALQSWEWVLGDTPLQPKFTSLFGDVFLVAQDNAIWYLDTLEGTLERRWTSREELAATLNTEAGLDRYLSGVWAMSAQRLGLALGPSDVYDWTVSPRMGAPLESANITVRPFVDSLQAAGQLHRQLREGPQSGSAEGVDAGQP